MSPNGNNEHIHEQDFKDWLPQYQRNQEIQNKNISDLASEVASLASTTRQILENQKGLFSRTNRPFQWGAFISALGLVMIGAGLIIAPIKGELNRSHEFHINAMEHIASDAAKDSRAATNIEWLMKLEQRHYRIIDSLRNTDEIR